MVHEYAIWGRLNYRQQNKQCMFFVVTYLLSIQLCLLLVSWYPGDPSIRAASESYFRLMFSPSGVSLGKTHLITPKVPSAQESTLSLLKQFGSNSQDADQEARGLEGRGMHIEYTQSSDTSSLQDPMSMHSSTSVQPMIPSWSSGDDIQFEYATTWNRTFKEEGCYFFVDDSTETMFLHDDGEVVKFDFATNSKLWLDSSRDEAEFSTLKCTHFRNKQMGRDDDAWETFLSDGSAGRVLILNSVSSLVMLAEYHKSLLNHQAYAQFRRYGFILSIIPPSMLHGRSGKFAKHISLGAHATLSSTRSKDSSGVASKTRWDTICHVDLDAWFSSWDPLSRYTDDWPADKDLMFGDTGQVWLNTGLLCVRPTSWIVSFMEQVVNARYQTLGTLPITRYDRVLYGQYQKIGVSGSGLGYALEHKDEASQIKHFGFLRDQPALWHVLFQDWKQSGHLERYQGQQCPAWGLCNPVTNPLQCWHWCFFDVLKDESWWSGLESINRLPHVHLVPQEVQPQLHNMCLRSCSNMMERSFMKFCSLLSNGYSRCYPEGVEELSLCDGIGCVKQMNGPAWLKHSGHKHWTKDLIATIPLSYIESREELLPMGPLSLRGSG